MTNPQSSVLSGLLASAVSLAALLVGVFAGLPWFVVVLFHWARLMDANGWDGSTAPNSLFVLHLVVGVVGVGLVGTVIHRVLIRRPVLMPLVFMLAVVLLIATFVSEVLTAG